MSSVVQNIAAGYLAPKVLKRFKWQYVVFGVAAYYGLKLLAKKGIFPAQTNKALNLIDQGVDYAKEQVGIHPSQRNQARKVTPAQMHADFPAIH